MRGYEDGTKTVVIQADLTPIQEQARSAYVDKCRSDIGEISQLRKKQQDVLDEINAKIIDRQYILQQAYAKKVDDMGSDIAGLRAQRDQIQAAINDAQQALADAQHKKEIVVASLQQSQQQIDANWVALSAQTQKVVEASNNLADQTQVLAEAQAAFEQEKKGHALEYSRKKSELDSRESIIINREQVLKNSTRRKI